MNELKTTTKLVKAILESDPMSRNSDSFLYFKVLDVISKKHNRDIIFMPVCDFLLNMKELQVPPFESVRRTRQKLQEKYPELAACDKVQAGRMEFEAEYRAFARSEV